MKNKKFFDTLRRWIDGEDAILEDAPKQVQSKWNDFFVAVARELSDTIEEEMFTPPGGPTYIPLQFWLFLNPEDNAEWQGEKRNGLERGLQHILMERAQTLAGQSGLQSSTLAIEIHSDAAVERNRFRIQPIWDAISEPTKVKQTKTKKLKEPTPASDGEPNEETLIRQRKPCFMLSLKRTGDKAKKETSINHPFRKNDIVIGRGSAKNNIDVDLKLSGDMEVSRVQARLKQINTDTYQLTCLGANPILLNEKYEVMKGDSVTIAATDKITIGSYELTICDPSEYGE
jgi:hypothetical protein